MPTSLPGGGRGGGGEMSRCRVVGEAVERLPEPHRAVIRECVVDHRSVAEAATRLGVPADTVKPRILAALRSLRDVLVEMGVAP
jgi:RNA polymerase sigma-70 factor, ECF subfamily